MSLNLDAAWMTSSTSTAGSASASASALAFGPGRALSQPLAPTWRQPRRPPRLEDAEPRRILFVRIWLILLLCAGVSLLGFTFVSAVVRSVGSSSSRASQASQAAPSERGADAAHSPRTQSPSPTPSPSPGPSVPPHPPPPSPASPPSPPPSPLTPVIELKDTRCEHVIGGIKVSFAHNQHCNDGGPGSVSALCPLGSDYPDCPVRHVRMRPRRRASGEPDEPADRPRGK